MYALKGLSLYLLGLNSDGGIYIYIYMYIYIYIYIIYSIYIYIYYTAGALQRGDSVGGASKEPHMIYIIYSIYIYIYIYI